MSDVDPGDARSRAEYVLLLRRRREATGLSYRQLERRARQDGGSLPPSTAATMLHRSTLPGAELVATYVRACGGDEAEVATWLAARARLASAEVRSEPDVPGPGGPLPAVPRQLPPAPAGMVGRQSLLVELDVATGDPEPGLVVVTGRPGVGKTALVVHWAHRVRHRFPGGQLYVDLRACGPDAPTGTVAALTHLLVGLGVPAASVPPDEQQAAALFRSAVADRQVLLLLDDAVSADQVRLLRPGGPGSCTVVTSRCAMAGLGAYDGARLVRVPPLDQAHAVRVLAQSAGEHLVAAEPAAAGRLADLCDRLPLALRIAATALDRAAHTPVADIVDAVHTTGRLAALDLPGDPRVRLRDVLDHSYRALEDDARQLFRALGTLPAIPVTAPVAAAALDGSVERARLLLRHLADRNLIVPTGADRYAVPGLHREYARLLGGAPGRTAAA